SGWLCGGGMGTGDGASSRQKLPELGELARRGAGGEGGAGGLIAGCEARRQARYVDGGSGVQGGDVGEGTGLATQDAVHQRGVVLGRAADQVFEAGPRDAEPLGI